MGTKRVTVLGLFIGIMAVALIGSGCATSGQQFWWSKHEPQRQGQATYAYMPYTVEEAKPAPPAAPEPMVVKAPPEVKEVLLPKEANPGECFARVFDPPRYETRTMQVLSRQASERVETIPAKFEVVEEKILVREASKRLEEVPAEYGWVEEKVLVKEAQTIWMEGRGMIEKVDNTTGEIMCLVEIPASYETVRRRVVVKPATVREVEVPAVYETIKVTRMVSPPQEKRISIPAEYETVTRTEKVSDGHMEWKRVLCETNLTPDVISKIQEALMRAGYNPGAINGVLHSQTRMAINSYQKQKGLAEGELTYEMMESLGIMMN